MEAMNQHNHGRILGDWNPGGLPPEIRPLPGFGLPPLILDPRPFPGIAQRCVIRNGEWIKVRQSEQGDYIFVKDEKGDHMVLIGNELVFLVNPLW